MGAIFSTARSLLNLLLPFTNPQTPLLQDLAHTAILLGTLYYAPQIAEWLNQPPRIPSNRATNDPNSHEDTTQEDLWALPPGLPPILDRDEMRRLHNRHPTPIVQHPDTDEEDAEPRPEAPTPPIDGGAGPANPPPRPFVEEEDEEQHLIGEPGPANIPPNQQPQQDRPRPTAANRTVGTKKAKSLARKDQRRAYYEFHRQEAEQQRLREAEGAEEREAALQAEKARRVEVERAIAERERLDRELKKEEERLEQERERERRERAVRSVREAVEREGAINLEQVAREEGKERVWVERLVKASGMLNQMSKEDAQVIITDAGWCVKVDKELMQKAYADAVVFGDHNNGKVSFEEFGGILEKVVMARANA